MKVIRRVDKRVKKGHRAMVVILTDGLENSSETSSREVRKLIHAREKAGWEFIFLGANQDACAKRFRDAPAAYRAELDDLDDRIEPGDDDVKRKRRGGSTRIVGEGPE